MICSWMLNYVPQEEELKDKYLTLKLAQGVGKLLPLKYRVSSEDIRGGLKVILEVEYNF